tara:strand:+ start:1342 stop:1566 length:225 start_codon:yes stop_codon:yes gene_type:complete
MNTNNTEENTNRITQLLTHAEQIVRDSQYAMKKYGGNPGKCRPQLDNLAQDLSSLRSTVNVIQLLLCELEGLVL